MPLLNRKKKTKRSYKNGDGIKALDSIRMS